MDFTRHEPEAPHHTRLESQPGAVNHEAAAVVPHHEKNHKKISSWTRVGFVTLLFATTLLVVAIAGLIAFTNTNQTKFIDKSKFQAVFINDGSSNGQSVYFGHVASLTSSYMILQDIYYITTTASNSTATSATANSNYTVTKLGCQQLHDPYDRMIINTSQVAFWENLQNSGKVVSAITQYQKDNPNGPNCSQTQSSSSVNTSSPQNGSSTQTP